MSEPKRHDKLAGVLFWAMAVVFAIGILAVAVPAFVKARRTSAANPCLNNLRQIDAAANVFALENNLPNGSPIRFPNDLTPYIKLDSSGHIPHCPSGGIYHLARVADTPTCSLSNTVVPPHIWR